jgi:hypothetical protein
MFYRIFITKLKNTLCGVYVYLFVHHLFVYSFLSFVFSADDQFSDLCFELGLELDEVVSIFLMHDKV